MTGSPTSDRSAVWRQDRRTDAAAARWAGRGSGRGRGRGPVRWLAVTPYAGLALVCLALGAVAFVLVAPPLGVVRDRLVDEVRASTGRSLVVHGPISATLFPRVVVSMTDVAVLPPEGFADGSTVTVPSLEAELSLRSLLSRRPKIERVTLHRPTFELTIDAQDRRSWDIAASRPRSQRLPATDSAGGEGASPNLPERPHKIEGVASVRSGPPRPWAVRVEDGTVRYRDERSGTRHEIAALNLDLGAEGRGGPVAVSGSLAWQGEPWRFSGTAAHEILEGRQGPVTLKLAGAPVEAAYAGTVAVKGGFAAEGALSLGRFAYKGLKIGPSELAVSVDAGVANVKLQQIELYDGRGQGTLTLDATGETPALAASLKLADLSLLPLLGDAAGVGWIDGRGTVALDLAAQGRSAEQIVETMRGKAQLAVADGALTGIDIDRGLRALQRGRLDRLAPRHEDRTPFSELSGSFDIVDGVAKNQDLKLVSAHLQLSGEGTVELARRRIDYTLQTKIAGGPPDDGAALRVGTIELPISVKGPLDRPEFAIKGQEGLTDAIRQIGRNLRSREVQDAVKGLIGGDGDKRTKPSELIERLLKKE
jgi:uncharacterized protein involved in outer membrane biogenesis